MLPCRVSRACRYVFSWGIHLFHGGCPVPAVHQGNVTLYKRRPAGMKCPEDSTGRCNRTYTVDNPAITGPAKFVRAAHDDHFLPVRHVWLHIGTHSFSSIISLSCMRFIGAGAEDVVEYSDMPPGAPFDYYHGNHAIGVKCRTCFLLECLRTIAVTFQAAVRSRFEIDCHAVAEPVSEDSFSFRSRRKPLA